VDGLRLPRNMAISPLFQVMLVLQNADMGEEAIEQYVLGSGISKFDLTLELTETAQGLKGLLEYSTALYQHASIERLIEHFIALCRSIVAEPTQSIAALEYLSEAQRRQVLSDFNHTSVSYRPELDVETLLARQVALNAEKPAVVMGESSLSYA